MVKIHAQTMSVAIPHRTALKRWMDPTPTMASAVTCVVEAGGAGCMKWAEKMIVMAAAASAQNPLRGFSLVRRAPRPWCV